MSDFFRWGFYACFLFSFAAGFLLILARRIIAQEFDSIRHWFMRNKGYGFAYFYESNKRIIRKYVKLVEPAIRWNDQLYAVYPERMFEFQGIKSLLFNTGDAEPLDVGEKNQTELLGHSSSFLDSLFEIIKTYAEKKAFSKVGNRLMMWLTILSGLVGMCLAAVFYLIYTLKPLLETAAAPIIGI